MTRPHRIGWLVVALLLATGLARAQEVGTIASLEGSAEIGRGGTWSAIKTGSAVQLHDMVRTGHPGRVRIAFQDDSTLSLGDDAQLTIDEQVFNPQQGKVRSLLHLIRGKVNAVVSDYYSQPSASYEIETPTAVAGVRGTEFIVAYNEETQATDVVGISGTVHVHSLSDRAGTGVFITASELTQIVPGQLPTAPDTIDGLFLHQYIEGLDFVGQGIPEGLAAAHPLVSGAVVQEPDRAPGSPLTDNITRNARDASGILEQPLIVDRGSLRVRF